MKTTQKSTIKTFKRFVTESNDKWYSLDLTTDMTNEQVALSEDWAEDLLGPVKQAPIVDHQKIENELKKLYDQKFYKQNRLYLPKINNLIYFLIAKYILDSTS
jgi:hypothetical protein